MEKLTVTKEFEWDCAHRLHSPDLTDDENADVFGLCNNIHGHTYKLQITVSYIRDKLKNGMIINFKDLKRIIKEEIVDKQDHSLNLTIGDPLEMPLMGKGLRINMYPFELTCENQVREFWDKLESKLSMEKIILEEIKLYETPTSFATLRKE